MSPVRSFLFPQEVNKYPTGTTAQQKSKSRENKSDLLQVDIEGCQKSCVLSPWTGCGTHKFKIRSGHWPCSQMLELLRYLSADPLQNEIKVEMLSLPMFWSEINVP